MTLPYWLLALFLGLITLAALEIASTLTGVITAMTPSLALDAAAFALGMVLLALVFAPLFRRVRGIGIIGGALLFLVLYPIVVGVAAAALDLTASGSWAFPSLVRGAFIAIPGNLLVTFTLELWYVAVPMVLASVLLLWRQARVGGRPRTPAAAS